MKYTQAIQAVLNRHIKSESDATGMLARVYNSSWGNCLILLFEDGRWAKYVAASDYDGNISFEIDSLGPDLLSYLRDAGLITDEEFHEQEESERQDRAARERQRELELLAKLKEKYE
jgi:hypothetical protein